MSKYKVGDKIVLEIISGEAYGDYLAGSKEQNWWFNAEGLERGSEPLGTYTEPLEAKIRRQAAEITRLLAENKKLKEDFEKSKRVNLNMGRLAGQNEAWELARKIVLKNGYSGYDLHEIFNCCGSHQALENCTYPEAAAKVSKWEKAKEEIKVGDILEDIYDSNVKCTVTNLYPNNRAYLVFDDGTAGMHELDNLKKTGRHIDINSFLKQIRGEQE